MTDYKIYTGWRPEHIGQQIIVEWGENDSGIIIELTNEQLIKVPITPTNPTGFVFDICNYCDRWDGYKYAESVFVDIFCCIICFEKQKFMFEYFRDKHPLLGNLSKLDYLDPKKRREEIAAQILIIREQSFQKCFLMKTILPADALFEIGIMYLALINKDVSRS